MLSIDTNLLLYAYSEAAPEHRAARAFLRSLGDEVRVALSEFVLVEFYGLLRNPSVLERPLRPAQAVKVIQAYRSHPDWQVVGFPSDSLAVHEDLWTRAANPGVSRRAIYDARTALSLRAFGVKEFATANPKDFDGFGLNRVWNPLAEKA